MYRVILKTHVANLWRAFWRSYRAVKLAGPETPEIYFFFYELQTKNIDTHDELRYINDAIKKDFR
jgi:hypothetical protein